ncbi:TPA: helix-turn-helix transcriptional regulator [Escherichia coli]|uniref:AraC family transcriptional regulator n=1 Tax=Escherichia coli TaxID=562 RepID=UPI00182216A9|nr:AraC family transcriptional regulator [Escherichia coli]EFC1633334.1 AraC family transcriptional regulator [Escherichia coli]EFC1647269.1 AraC family transcriptional regulator [Escherichia coli]MCQ1961903.1 AraC family transcriptional regulator [Escherichia coli]MCQ1970839.1 AraC family transcriptional regulator [Escherichia coli]HAV8301962.1 helix-turn-helix transcriptional regulator [Escherichia coli]
MNKITALERVNVLYSVIYAGQNSNINNIRLRSSILLYIKQSGIVLKINNGKDIIPHKDSVFFIDKGAVVTLQTKKSESYDIYYFSISEIKRAFNILCTLIFNASDYEERTNYNQDNYKGNYLYVKLAEGDYFIFKRLHSDISVLRKTHVLLYFLSGHATSLLFYFFRKNIEFSFSESVKLIIEEDLSASWKISDICNIMYISESSVRKKLLQENKTFCGILLEARMQAAAKMILTTEKHINAVSKRVGYSSPSYFIKSFKNFFKITPKQLSLKVRRTSTEK